tara:strand:- start:5417 stop:5632 length:216 start_codon:yes stop_codon:yes gene_type:complete
MFENMDALVAKVAKETPSKLDLLNERIVSQLTIASADELAAELRRPSSGLQFIQQATLREAVARILKVCSL